MHLCNKYRLDLQLFAEGGAGDGGTGVVANVPGSHDGVKGSETQTVIYGKQDGEVHTADVPQTEDRKAKFEALIKGEYKDLYDARVSDTIQKRLKGSKETVDRYNALAPTLDILSKKYGVDVSDIEALNKAIEDDDSYFQEEAFDRGISVEQLKSIRKMERENAELKRQMQERTIKDNADRIYQRWMDESSNLKGVYPSFDLDTELSNPRFVDLIKNNIDVRTAYEVIHKDEIIPAAMQFTADAVTKKITNKIMSNGIRPKENGTGSNSSAIVKSDVASLSKSDRDEIARRVARGEKIRF